MALIEDVVMTVNSGRAFIVKKGQRIRIITESTNDFVVFNLDNLTERFDQARTRSNQAKIYLSTGDVLYSRQNRVMMTIVEDTYKNGHHDLLYGMCSGPIYSMRWKQRHESSSHSERFKKYGITKREDTPLWGCQENIMYALQDYPILPMDIPAPFNIVWSMEIDPTGNIIWHLDRDRPEEPIHIDLRAEMNCLCACSVCPEGGKMGHAKPQRIQVFDD